MPAYRDACIHGLFHFDEATGVFTNSGVRPVALTPFGTGQGSSAASKFGAYCYAGNPAAWGGVQAAVPAPGTGMFLLSGWVYLIANPATQLRAFGVGKTVPRPCIEVTSAGKVAALLSSSTSLVSTSSLPLNTWAHVETHRDSQNVWRLTINGAVEASASNTVDQGLSLTTLDIGANSSSNPGVSLNCRIDEVLFLRGLTDHEGAFTPEAAAYVNPDPFGAVGLGRPASLQAFPPTWPARIVGLTPPPPVYRAFWGGLGRIVGTTKIKGTPNTPVSRRVRLIREVDAVCVGERWSDPVTGAYAFNGFDPLQLYTVIVYDGPRVFRAAVQDAVVPEVYTP